MPRRSERDKLLRDLHIELQNDIVKTFAIPLLCNDSSDDDTDEEEDRQMVVVAKIAAYTAMEDCCYLFREPKYRNDIRLINKSNLMPRWKQILNGTIYNDEEFLKFFRVPRVMFLNFARLFKDHPSFSTTIKQRRHFSHKLHLLVAFKYFGSQGNAASAFHVKDGLDLGKGSVLNYLDRAVAAILSFQSKSIFWPSPAE
jgi:hypothetical protein